VSADDVKALEEVRDEHGVRRARDFRRAALIGLTVLVVGGLVGVFGIRSATATDSGAGYTLSVLHAQVTRAGIAVPFHVDVRRAGGFTGPVEVQVQASLMERFDFQNFYPNPSKETATGRFLVYQFDPPPGDELRISLDARTAPDQNGSVGRYTVRLVAGGQTVAEVSFRMVVVP
jgi:hypothetical protein